MSAQSTPLSRKLTLIALVAAFTAAAPAALIDDFNDGDDAGWTHIDLLNQFGLGPTIYDASGGTYAISSSNPLPQTPSLVGTGSFWTDSANDPFYSDGYMRMRFSSDNLITNPFGAMRMNPVAGDYYTFFAIPEGDGTIGISKVTGFTESSDLASMDFAITPGNWYWMEAGTVGDQLSLKVWAVGEPEPGVPQVTAVDTDITAGALAVGLYKFGNETGTISAAFDDISFVPEPASLGMALAALAALRRRR
jgi:hypothetical protein